MCAGAIEWMGFAAVYYGSSVPYIASQGQIQVRVPMRLPILCNTDTHWHHDSCRYILGPLLHFESFVPLMCFPSRS